MLILTRRPGESVKIGDDITVTVLDIRRNQLRLGFTAPQNVSVHREEVYRRIQAEKVANISQARSASPPLRLVETPDHAGPANVTEIGACADAAGKEYVEPPLARARLKVSPQTKKELSKW